MISPEDANFNFNDEELVELAQNGTAYAEKAIIEKYRNVIKLMTGAYFSRLSLQNSVLLDADDLFQESMLGFLSAVYSYKKDKGASFKTYSYKCVYNAIYRAINASSRKKNTPPMGVVSIEDIDLPSTLSLEEDYISNENINDINIFLDNELTSLEKSVIKLYLSDYNYKGIAKKLVITEKAVDNAIQRVRGKLKKYLAQNRS